MGRSTLYRPTDREHAGAKEESMYLGVVFVYAIILVLASPIIWIVWWLLADLGERAAGSYTRVHSVSTAESRRPGRLHAA